MKLVGKPASPDGVGLVWSPGRRWLQGIGIILLQTNGEKGYAESILTVHEGFCKINKKQYQFILLICY